MMNDIQRLIAGLILASAAFGTARGAEPVVVIKAWPLYEPCSVAGPAVDSPERLTPILTRLRDTSPAARAAAITTLAAQCARGSIETILTMLDDPEAVVRLAAVEALGTLRDPRLADDPTAEARTGQIIARLLALAPDADWRVRAALTRTLASFQVYQASNAVLNLIANPGGRKIVEAEDLRVRCQAILMVNQLRDVRFSRKGIGFLFGFIDYADPALQAIAVEAARELKQTRNGYHELVGIARKPGFPAYRLRAIEWLAEWKMVEARPALEEIVAGEPNPKLKEAAGRALERIGGGR